MEGIEPSCAGVVDELSVERIADGIVLDLWPPLVLVEGGGVELGVGLVDPLSVGLLDGLVPVPVLVNGRVELCTSAVDELFAGLVPKGGAGPCVSVVEGLFVGLVDIDFPLLVPMIMLGVRLRTDGDNVLFDEGLINEVANNTSEFEFSQHAYRSFCGTNSENEIYNNGFVSMYLHKLPLILPETASDGWVLGWGTNFGSWIVRRLTRAP
jgi:hypothetical protein